MTNTVRIGGAIILALIFALGFYIVLSALEIAIFIGLCAGLAWLMLAIVFGRRSDRR
ncbi:hypothetical protein GCM10027447_05030 [Glycomyces halotolerans]